MKDQTREKEAPKTAENRGFRDAKRAEMLRQVSEDTPSKLALFERVYDGKAGRQEAIKAQCTLWGFRPYVRKGG